jgi:dolichol-phosphate mannosyltransferase
MSELAMAIVVIPTYNEADNIEAVIDRVRSAAPSITILVVDDNSPDGTADLVRAHRDHLHRVFLLPHGQ